jgi:hypothetical protein
LRAPCAAELGEREALPLRRGLNDLGIEGVHAVVADVERDRGARAVAVEMVVDAGGCVDDERHLHLDEMEPPAELVLDQPLRRVQRLHRLARREQGRGSRAACHPAARADASEAGPIAGSAKYAAALRPI